MRPDDGGPHFFTVQTWIKRNMRRITADVHHHRFWERKKTQQKSKSLLWRHNIQETTQNGSATSVKVIVMDSLGILFPKFYTSERQHLHLNDQVFKKAKERKKKSFHALFLGLKIPFYYVDPVASHVFLRNFILILYWRERWNKRRISPLFMMQKDAIWMQMHF